MAVGYAVGPVFKLDRRTSKQSADRGRTCRHREFRSAWTNVYGDPAPWSVCRTAGSQRCCRSSIARSIRRRSVSLTNMPTDVMTLLAKPGTDGTFCFLHIRQPGTLGVDQKRPLRCKAGQMRPMVPLRMRSANAMRLHSYRDESHSRHFDLIGGGDHPWSN